MPLRPRLFVSGGIYHVYCRTHRGEFRFEDCLESESFIEVVADVVRTHGLVVLAWCLMSNHYHMAVQTADVKLWRSMARIQGRITRSFNRRHRVFGPSWQGRYRARLIQEPDDLRHLLAYIHLNPVMAGLEDDPANWEYSGHRAIIGRTEPVLVDVVSALRCFEEETQAEARQTYFEYLRCVAEARWARSSVRSLPWWQKANDDHQTVREEDAPSQARTFDDKYPDLPSVIDEPVESLLERASPLLKVPVLEICGPRKYAATVLARKRFSLIAVRYFHHSLKSIGNALRKNPSQVGRWLAQETEAYYNDPTEAIEIDTITATLLKSQSPASEGTFA